jgi:thiamine biosynthesis lipoprotein
MIQALIFLHTFFIPVNTEKDSIYTYHINGFAQGTSYHIAYCSKSSIIKQNEIDELLSSIDSSLSLYKSYSLINRFNLEHRGIKMDTHFKQVILKSNDIAASTKGAFDITCKPAIQLWNAALSVNKIPSRQQIKRVLNYVGYKHLSIKGDSLIKNNPNVQIDCDGIAQGYSVDQIASLLLKYHINDFIVELGGEVFAHGKPLDKNSWHTSVQSSSSQRMLTDAYIIALNNAALTTSGSMNKFIRIGNNYYSHIYNPITGKPIQEKIISVTILANDAITADALDNALMVMGTKTVFEWLKNNPSIGAFIVYENKEGKKMAISNPLFDRFLVH